MAIGIRASETHPGNTPPQVLADGGSLDAARAAAADEAGIEQHRAKEIALHHQSDPAHPPPPGSFLAAGEKRVANRRVKEELGVRLRFPSYQEGLAAIAAGDVSPWPAASATPASPQQQQMY